MKRKIITIIFVVSLILNVTLGVMIFNKSKDVTYYEQGFLREISFAVQRLEEYQVAPTESTYMVAVAHLYSAYTYYTMLVNLNDEEWTYKLLNDFHELWNYAAAYTDQVQMKIPAIIDILSLIEEDKDFNDTTAQLKLQEVIAEIQQSAK